MYCPKCAASNAEDSKFCRSCGMNLSLVSQVVTGRIGADTLTGRHEGRRRHRGRKDEPPSLQAGIVQVFIGIGFLVAALCLLLTGENWWWAFIFPAFPTLGKGVASIVGWKQLQSGDARLRASQPLIDSAPRTGELYDSPERAMIPPASVTEGTTRIMNQSPERGENQ